VRRILHIATVQYDIEWHNINANLSKINTLLIRLNSQVDLILLPEMFATGFTMQPELFCEEDYQSVQDWMHSVSKKYNAAVLGSFPARVKNKFYNRLYFIPPEGPLQFYDKRHLFTMGDEPQHYVAGEKMRIIEYNGWKLYPLICYDLRFPVWSRNVKYKYDLLIFSANWPSVRNDAWETLLKARAIENQCYVAGINRIGKDGRNIQYIGNTQIVSPAGEVIHKIENKEGILCGDLDLQLLGKFRNSFPVLNDADEFKLK